MSDKAYLPPHIFSQCVNSLREAAVKYSGTQQMRAHIVKALSEFVTHEKPVAKQTTQEPLGYLENGKGFMYEPRHKELIKNPTPVYLHPEGFSDKDPYIEQQI